MDKKLISDHPFLDFETLKRARSLGPAGFEWEELVANAPSTRDAIPLNPAPEHQAALLAAGLIEQTVEGGVQVPLTIACFDCDRVPKHWGMLKTLGWKRSEK